MNASHRRFANFGLIVLLSSSGLSGCAVTNPLATAPLDPNSKIAGEVARIGNESREYPTFAGIPPAPTDERPLKAWGRAAAQAEKDRLQLERETADNTWTLRGTEAFAQSALRTAGPAPAAMSSTSAATEAYARDLSKRATPPPPPKR